MSDIAKLATILHCEESEVIEYVESLVKELDETEKERDEFEEEKDELSNDVDHLECSLEEVEGEIDDFVKKLDNYNDYKDLQGYDNLERMLEDITDSLRELSKDIHENLNQ